MSVLFRDATETDIPTVIALLTDDVLGQRRETSVLDRYLAAFRDMSAEPHNALIVGELDGRVVACYQLTLITGVSLRATRRAQIEGVRVASAKREQGIGEALMLDAEARALSAGARLLQFTSNATRTRAHGFYERLGYVPSHVGFKKSL